MIPDELANHMYRHLDRYMVYYVGDDMFKKIMAAKVVSIVSSVAALTLTGTLLSSGVTPFGVVTIVMCSLFSCTPFLLHHFVKRVVLELLYDDTTDRFVATTFKFMPWREYYPFGWEDVMAPDPPGPFESFRIRRRPAGKPKQKLLLFEDGLLRPESIALYKRLVGLDKEAIQRDLEKTQYKRP